MKELNDNEPLPFQTLAAATAAALANHTPKKDQDDDAERDHIERDRSKTDEQKRYVEQRLRELAEFERRASGFRRR